MTTHRELNLETFINAVNRTDSSLLDRYLIKRFEPGKLPSCPSSLRHNFIEYVFQIVSEEDREIINEDFKRFNDICERMTKHMFSTSQLFDVKDIPDETAQARAIRLFLDYPDAFEYAWALYCIFGTLGKISWHNLRCPEFSFDEEKRLALEKELADYFAESAMGEECEITKFDDVERLVLFIDRGSYFRTISYWQNKKRITSTIRPVYEDALIYEKASGQLGIKPLSRDKEQYIKSFTKVIGYPALANSPDRDNVFNLQPMLDGGFDWNGNEYITSIVPLEARLKFKNFTEPVINIRSKNLRKTLEDFGNPAVTSAVLAHIKLRFTLAIEGKEDKVTFVITPPYATDLIKKAHSKIITEYLKENGVQS